eukprot:16430395-Heterocapsa_arctica.AAC.1
MALCQSCPMSPRHAHLDSLVLVYEVVPEISHGLKALDLGEGHEFRPRLLGLPRVSLTAAASCPCLCRQRGNHADELCLHLPRYRKESAEVVQRLGALRVHD